MTTKELAQAVLDAPSACPEFKEAAQNYLNAIGTDDEKKAGEILVTEAEEDISPIDGTIEFFATDMAKDIFGAEVAAQKLAHAKEIKEQGAIYCDCPGCKAALDIISNKNIF
ncbi:MAG: molecular chaperone Hsp90 [Ruminococcaceae bacterium]|nr:molecular chaperone Hsp90 [Oscillospiraceae bacterium]